MGSVVLKVDVDTLRGTQEGVPRLGALFARLGIPATFLFSLGPDNTGRALRRVFRRGFLAKVRRTSVVSNYGLRTLMYGTLIPGPDIGKRCRVEMLAIQSQGFEVGVHTWDHVKWQDGVARASSEWTASSSPGGCVRSKRYSAFPPRVHGAAGWQMNEHVPKLQAQFGFEVASDTRGTTPFAPEGGGVMQIPTTLPTLDEILERDDPDGAKALDTLLALTGGCAHSRSRLHAACRTGRWRLSTAVRAAAAGVARRGRGVHHAGCGGKAVSAARAAGVPHRGG